MHSEPYKEEQPYGCIFLAIHLEVKKVCLSQHSARRPINHVSIEMNVWYVVVLGGWALGNKRLLHFVRYVGLNYFVCTTAVDKANIHLGSSNAVAKLRWEYSVVRHQTNVHARPLSASLHVCSAQQVNAWRKDITDNISLQATESSLLDPDHSYDDIVRMTWCLWLAITGLKHTVVGIGAG